MRNHPTDQRRTARHLPAAVAVFAAFCRRTSAMATGRLPAAAAAFALLCGAAFAADDKARPYLETRMLSAELSARAANQALAACTEKGWQVAVAVVSREGHLSHFARHPLAGPHTITISRKKAYTAAVARVPTHSVADIEQLNFMPRMTTMRGGVPISVGGYFYGGIGVSGATSEDDEVCAQAGVEAVAEELEFGE